MNFATCTICDQKFRGSSKLLAHVKKTHRYDPRFRFQCSLCHTTCKSYRILYRHYVKMHKNFVDDTCDDDHAVHVGATSENQDIENDKSTVDLRIEAAKSILCIKEGSLITEASTNRVVEHMQSITESHLEKVKERLIELGIPVENFADVLTCSETFKDLQTEVQREKTFTDIFSLIKPQAITFGTTLEWRKRKGVLELKEVKAIGHFIPFLETLQKWISHKNFKKALKKSSNAVSNDIFKDMSDGSFYRNHPILSDGDTIAIVAYYDDIEVANPLGSKIKTHKLAVFYWYIANIDPAFRSQLSVINLLAVAKTKYVRQYGADAILKDFLDGLAILENGYSFDNNGVMTTIRGALLAFPSDTLASNYIGGFKESPSFSFSPCRLCTIKKSMMKSVFCENQVTLRDSTTHKEQIKIILNKNLSLPAHTYWSKMYGIVRQSVFAEAPHFDVTKCFVLDIMHVLFEGVVLQEIKLLLQHCLEKKYFPSLNVINNYLKTFNLIGASNTDCPTELDISVIKDPKKKIKQHAAQSWRLAVILPFLIGSYVPNGDKHYENFITLLKIITICTSFQINREDIVVLQQLVCVYISTFVNLYSQNSVTPKMHYLVHLPTQILMFGPPRYLWCFRLEAKHRRLKQSILVSQNFKNVSLTVAKRLQAFSCLESSQASEFLVKKTKIFNYNRIEEQSLPTYANLNVNPMNNILEINSVIFRNITYSVGFNLLYEVTEDEFPCFVSIKHLYNIDNIIFLVCQKNKTLRYMEKFNSFVVSALQDFITLEISSLEYEHPVYAVIYRRETHIILHHYSCIGFDYSL